MSDRNAKQVSGFAAAFAVGAVAGAGIALLYAPRSGKETRKMLADKGRELKSKATDAMEDAKVYIDDRTSGMAMRATDTDA